MGPAKPPTPQQPVLPLTPPSTLCRWRVDQVHLRRHCRPPGSHNSRATGSSSCNAPQSVVPPAAVPASLSLLTPSSSNSNSNVDDDVVAYKFTLEQDIFWDVFKEVDGDDDGEEEEMHSAGVEWTLFGGGGGWFRWYLECDQGLAVEP